MHCTHRNTTELGETWYIPAEKRFEPTKNGSQLATGGWKTNKAETYQDMPVTMGVGLDGLGWPNR
jgi:hypothetical protein